jgi:adenylosuccinate synthase
MINGIDEIALTLLDVLSGLKTIKICTSYLLNGKNIDKLPEDVEQLANVQPQYLELPGWEEDISNVKEFKELPINAQNYVLKIEELLHSTVTIISVGPDRKQTIFRNGRIST